MTGRSHPMLETPKQAVQRKYPNAVVYYEPLMATYICWRSPFDIGNLASKIGDGRSAPLAWLRAWEKMK